MAEQAIATAKQNVDVKIQELNQMQNSRMKSIEQMNEVSKKLLDCQGKQNKLSRDITLQDALK